MFPLNANLKNDMLENTLICVLGRDEISSDERYLLFSCYYDGKPIFKSTPTLQWWAAICVHSYLASPWFSTGERIRFLNVGVRTPFASISRVPFPRKGL